MHCTINSQVSLTIPSYRKDEHQSWIMPNQDTTRFDELARNMNEMVNMLEALNSRLNELEQTSSQNLEKMVKKDLNKDAYFDSPGIESYLIDSLPQMFSANDLPKFKATDDPRVHLKAFKLYMEIETVDSKLYPRFFPMSL